MVKELKKYNINYHCVRTHQCIPMTNNNGHKYIQILCGVEAERIEPQTHTYSSREGQKYPFNPYRFGWK